MAIRCFLSIPTTKSLHLQSYHIPTNRHFTNMTRFPKVPFNEVCATYKGAIEHAKRRSIVVTTSGGKRKLNKTRACKLTGKPKQCFWADNRAL